MTRQKKSKAHKANTARSRRKRMAPKAVVDAVTTTTTLRTEPTIEIRRAATLSQALTEPAVAVVKPKTTVVGRKVRRTRRSA